MPTDQAFSLEELQAKAFRAASLKFSDALPSDITLCVGDELSKQDLDKLKVDGLLIWDIGFKLKPFMQTVSNLEHQLFTVIYYGDGVIGRYCAGYALGCVNEERKSLELNFIEKRCNASEDLRHMILPAVYEAWTTYVYALIDLFDFNIEKFVLLGPVPGVKHYYRDAGFKCVDDYFGSDAMIKEL